MGGIVFIAVAIVAIIIVAKIIAYMKGNEVIECASCSNRMTRKHFKQKGGCPRCGSDLIGRTGKQAGADQKGLE